MIKSPLMPALSPRRPADASCAPRRLFFALTLPPARRRQLVDWRAARFPAETGRPVAQANLHLTRAFLGNVGAAQEQALRPAAGRLRQPAFDLRLDAAATGRARGWCGSAAAARRANCCNWRHGCAIGRPATVVTKVRCRFIRTFRSSDRRPNRWRYRRTRRAGRPA